VPASKDDPFEQIDFGSFFQEYLDPGYRSPESEFVEKPSFENFISKPTTLTEHLMWQLGSIHVSPAVYRAAELVIGNLNEDGYLIASNEELMAASRGERAAKPLEPVAARSAPISAADAEMITSPDSTTNVMASADSLSEPISLSAMDLAEDSALEHANSESQAEAQFAAVGLMDVPTVPASSTESA